jgi:murein tripeptide amidase MpaA
MTRYVNCKEMASQRSFRFLGFTVLLTAAILCNACHTVKPVQQTGKSTVSAAASGDSNSGNFKWQQHKDYAFNKGTLIFTNRFATARLSNVLQQNDSTFTIDILPENTPVNPSPWYAFKVWSSVKRNIYLTLHYPGYKHRYDPKLSYDYKTWQPVNKVKVSANEQDAAFKMEATNDTVAVAGQELISSADTYRWIDTLAKLPFIKKQVAGKSLGGKPITVLSTKGSPGKKLIVVLSRQHPPEVTGYMAMQEFIRTTLDNTDLAKKFRSAFELLIVPMVNPDGVDEGNWRNSTAGVDLNRDWNGFNQPETRAVKDYVFKMVKDQDAKVYFAIDFHSTFYDVFYINQLKDPDRSNCPGFTSHWLAAIQQAIPGFKPNIKPSGNGSDVSKSWFSRVLQAEAITYEVGDNTSREQLKQKGRVAAEEMMKILVKP